jgi:hypothetical protein
VRLSTAICVEDLPSLDLVESTPDPVGLAGAEGVLEAGIGDRTGVADRLREPLADEADVLALEVRGREEGGGVLAAAGPSALPGECVIVLVATERHVVPPCRAP